ncbi:MAG: NUDIX hydrolase [Myxococcales bacterium]|nr:NUDIX hydrolase [Myxococcales bacterium]
MRHLPSTGVLLLAFALGCEDPPAETAPPEETPSAPAEDPPAFEGLEGFWSAEQSDVILSRAEEFDVEADTSELTEGEQAALDELLAVGEVMQGLYERSRHPQAEAVGAYLTAYEPTSEAETGRLERLRRLFRAASGPLILDLEGERVPFAPVTPAYEPGRNVYPTGLDRETLERWLEAHPEEAPSIRAVRTVVRRRSEASLTADRAVMEAHPWIAALHPELEDRLASGPDDEGFYAVPYSLAYADDLAEASRRLFAAARHVRADDADFADYLEQRARDLLSNDYEAGDAAWTQGRFSHLNAQIGAYETYDDHLLGQKAFFSTSLLIRNAQASRELEGAVARLADFEAALPGGPYTDVRARIPIGIYDVHADFGQARGGNTASILPNEEHVTRKYGRTILIRRNVITNPAILAAAQARFRAAVTDAHADDLGERGNFDRTVWHEVGHYLGPKRTTDDRVVTEALGQWHNHIEELKADLVSLWLMPRLVELGVIDEARRRSAYAAGVLRVLVTIRPPRTSPYATMCLMQQSWLLEHGALSFEDGRFIIDYDRYPAAVEAMLTEVLAIQRAGDEAAAEAFIDRWARWDDAVQGVIGRATDGVAPRYWIPRYAALH